MRTAKRSGWRRLAILGLAVGLPCVPAGAIEVVEAGGAAHPSATAPTTGTEIADGHVAIASMAPACAIVFEHETMPAGYSGVTGFLRDRALDMCDLFRVRCHVPRGYRSAGFKLRGTVLAQVGIIFVDGRSAGVDRRGVGVWQERRCEGGVGPGYVSKVRSEMISGNRYTHTDYAWSRLYWRGIVRNGIFWDDGRRHPLSCGAELQLIFFGLEVETYPLEWIDAALGWIGLDSPNDDESRVLRQWQQILSIPELQVRDEWRESPPLKKAIVPPEEEAVFPAERTIVEPEAAGNSEG